MRNVDALLLGDKMDDAVTHYINSHQPGEHVHIDTNGMPMSVQDDGGRITVMNQPSYSHLCRQVSVGEAVGEGPWGEELLDPDTRIAAIVAQLASARTAHKVTRNEVDTSVILDSSIRFNGQNLQSVSLAGLPPLQTLPPLQEMKRCGADWFTDKNKRNESLTDSDGGAEPARGAAGRGAAGGGAGGAAAAQRQASRKSLPHKKRISRKLKRNGGSTPHQELVVINNIDPGVTPVVEDEQILPDNYVSVPTAGHHIPHEVRPILICQICGQFYGEEQLKFFQHLKQHYEPHPTLIIDNPVSDLVIDKIANNCIVDNVAQLPDSIVELSLENTAPKAMYQPIDKHANMHQVPLNYNNMKVQYTMASMVKVPPVEPEKADLYETLDKLELFNCGKCSRTFRKQRHCDQHVREAHPHHTKLEDMGEFSEPEDLMAGIHVCVGEYEVPLLHLTVDNGHVHQDHTRHWYSRNGQPIEPCENCNECNSEAYCPRAHNTHGHDTHPHGTHPHGTHPHGTHLHDTHPHDSHPHDTHPHDTHPHDTHPHDTHPHNTHTHEHTHDTHSHSAHGPVQETQPLKVLKEEVLRRILETEVPVPTSISYSNIIHEQNETEDPGPSPEANEQSETADVTDSALTDQYDRKDININREEKKRSEEKHNAKSGGNGKQRKRLECGECGRVFSHRNSLMYHALSHAARQHACTLCDKTFLTSAALKIHKRVHNGDKPYKCDLCGRDFRQWSDLKYHTISLHSNEKQFKCDFCGKEFARKYSLNVHRRIHTGERNYKCNYCSKTFSAASYRQTHMRTHTGDRPFKCEQCEKSFRSGFDLRRHCLIHDRVRNRFDENKIKAKDKKAKPDKEEKTLTPKEIKEQQPPPSPETPKQSPKKKTNKKGAPNVTIQNRAQFKIEYPASDPFDVKPTLTKFKVIYNENEFKPEYKPLPYRDNDRDVVRTVRDDRHYRETTDGKLQIYTHIEKGKEYSGSIVSTPQVLGDIRHLDRDVTREVRGDSMNGEAENVFIERLTALYNVPA